eukprot:NODE_3_length_80033_cov_0.932970.p42 type:complete len:231 gc:universal NODE_3_length_80033_cov_0.932970:37222-36530(-)
MKEIFAPGSETHLLESEFESLRGIYIRTIKAIKSDMSEEQQKKYFGISDREDGIYEGGFKCWECQNDLIKLQKTLTGRVLDLGSGVGLLGISLAKISQETSIDFIDFNEEVIKFATIPNAIHNLGSRRVNQSRFFSGDWNDLDEDLKYNYIVAGDILYSAKKYLEIIRVIKKHLLPKGICLIATKSRYFGLDGNVDEFIKIGISLGLSFIKELSNSKGIKRYILQVTFPL